MNREEQLTHISKAIDVVTKRPVPDKCVPGGDESAYNWFWYGANGAKTLIIRVDYNEGQREQDGTIVGLRVPLTKIAVRHKGESLPFAEEGEQTHLLSFDTSTAPRLTEVTGLVDALNAALGVPLRV